MHVLYGPYIYHQILLYHKVGDVIHRSHKAGPECTNIQKGHTIRTLESETDEMETGRSLTVWRAKSREKTL